MSKEDIDTVSRQAQDYYQVTPVIILGSGASSAFGMSGMWKLSQHLISDVSSDDFSPSNQESWKNFCDLLNDDVDLETALHRIPLSTELTERIVLSTWGLLTPEDLAVFDRSLTTNNLFPLGKLLRHMFRSTLSDINIITPNYDRLAEYACEQENIHHYCGFSHGYRKTLVERDYLKCKRQVNIWKVHGSLDWFIDDKGVIFSVTNVKNIPSGLIPLIVTPGIDKYRNTHKEPYKSAIHESDNVIDAAKSYLCIGFGFNDEHIQEKLVNRCAKKDAKIIVVTHKLSDAAKKFLFGGNVESYLAIESGSSNDESIVYSSLQKDPMTVNGNYWSLDGFLKLIT